MPMNPRLLRPIASSLDPDAAVYLNAVAAADGEQLEPAVKKAINDFVKGCKQDGIWNAIKASCILAGARTLAGALVPLKGSAPTNNGPFVTGDYNRETGLVGNGSTKYLNTNRNNNADPQDNNHNAVYVTSLGGAGTKAYMGADGALVTGTNVILSVGFRNRTTSAVLRTTTAAGLVGMSRSISSAIDVRLNGASELAIANNSQVPENGNLSVFRRNNSGNESYADARLALYSIGESLDLADLDTRVSALITAIGAAI